MIDVTYASLMDVLKAFSTHKCGKDGLLASDNPKQLEIGWICAKCDEKFNMKLKDLKKDPFRNWVITPQMRVEFPKSRSGYLFILEEL